MSIRIKSNEALPPFRWWLWAIFEDRDGREWRVAILRLPSYQWRPSYSSDRYAWHQLELVYHGNDGFSFGWRELWDER